MRKDKKARNIAITKAGPTITFAQFVRRTRALPSIPTAVAATQLSLANSHPFSAIFEDLGPHHAWHVGTVALAALSQSASEPLREKLHSFPTPNIRPLLVAAAGIRSRAINASGRNSLLRKQLTLSEIPRMMCCQFTLQMEAQSQVTQLLCIFGLHNPGGAIQRHSFLDPLFQKYYRCTTREYLTLTFALWSHSITNPIFDRTDFLSKTIDPAKNEAILESILAEQACAVGDVGSRVESMKNFEQEALPLKFYSTTPMVQVSACQFLFPPQSYMLFHALKGPFFKVIELAIRDAKDSGSSKPASNRYAQEMGRRFEGYTKSILASSSARGRIFDEYLYKGGGDFSPDHLVIRGRNVVLIQEKLKRLSPGAFFGYDPTALASDAKAVLAESIWKSIRFVYRLEQAANQELPLEFHVVNSAVLRAKNFILLGVMPLMPSVFRADIYRQHLWEGVLAALDVDERNWLSRTKRTFRWHIVEATELITWISCAKAKGLFASLDQYLRQTDFSVLASECGFPASFAEWVLRASRKEGRVHPPKYIRKCFANFYDDLGKDLFGASGDSKAPAKCT